MVTGKYSTIMSLFSLKQSQYPEILRFKQYSSFLYVLGHPQIPCTSVTIAKLADSIVIREESDIDKIAEAIVRKIEQTSDNMPQTA